MDMLPAMDDGHAGMQTRHMGTRHIENKTHGLCLVLARRCALFPVYCFPVGLFSGGGHDS